MNYDMAMIDALDARAKRRESRREFFKTAGGAAVAVAGASALAACGDDDDNDTGTTPAPPTGTAPPPPPPAPAAIGDPEILNFALNLEYLEAEFYSYAVYGTGLDASLRTGTGTQGLVTPGRRVAFTDPVVAQYALEIAQDEIAHVRFLRSPAALGSAAVAEPAIDIGSGPTSAFSAAARAAGLIGAGQAFDPYASDENFLLASYLFEDVGVTAYKGASPLITSRVFLEAAAGILAAEAYHAGLIRTILYRKGLDTPSLRTGTVSISNARDSLDGASDIDQGVVGTADVSNIVPTDANGIAFSRNTGQVLNIVYLNSAAVTTGGFFPNGVNGVIQRSQQN